jgi:hypothetical protein
MISPGFIETSVAHGMIVDVLSEQTARHCIWKAGRYSSWRPGRPEEVAGTDLLPRAGYISGVDYVIDRGAVPTVV